MVFLKKSYGLNQMMKNHIRKKSYVFLKKTDARPEPTYNNF